MTPTSTLAAALALCLASTASSGPITSTDSVSSFASALFTKFDSNSAKVPSECVKFSVPGTSQSFVRCANNDRDPMFLVSGDAMKQIWNSLASWKSKATTINSRRRDYSVTRFDTIDFDASIWTIEHGQACQDQSIKDKSCLLLQFVRYEPMGQYAAPGTICGLPNTGKCYPNAECKGQHTQNSIAACEYIYSPYHGPCGGGGGFDPVCEPSLKCQYPGPFQGVRGRCVRQDEPTLGGDRNGEGGPCGTRFEGCASPFTCYLNKCRALAGPHSSCGQGTFAECVPGFQCMFSPQDTKPVPADARGVCFPVKGKLNDVCEPSTGCQDGLECADKGGSFRLCAAPGGK